MSPFLTGSRAYGRPRDDSDYDLVVFLSPADVDTLSRGADSVQRPKDDSNTQGFSMRSLAMRFGKLNLLAFTCPIAYAAWLACTQELVRVAQEGRRVTREEAIRVFRAYRAKHGTLDDPVDVRATLGMTRSSPPVLPDEED